MGGPICVSLLIVGVPGVGKSTFANEIAMAAGYTDEELIFLESNSMTSCTQAPKTSQPFIYELGGMEYSITITDTPGIPDTNPKESINFYNMIIEEANKSPNLIIFMQDSGRIDDEKLGSMKPLFAELNNALAPKVGLYNNKVDLRARKRGSKEQQEAEFRTKVNQLDVNFKEWCEKVALQMTSTHVSANQNDLSEIAEIFLKVACGYRPTEGGPHLRNFDDLEELYNCARSLAERTQSEYERKVLQNEARIKALEESAGYAKQYTETWWDTALLGYYARGLLTCEEQLEIARQEKRAFELNEAAELAKVEETLNANATSYESLIKALRPSGYGISS